MHSDSIDSTVNPLEIPSASSHKSLQSHSRRSERRLAVSRARNPGLELSHIDAEERAAMRDWRACDGIENPVERVDARLKVSKILDTLRERRRIILGIPLPGSRRAGTERKPILPMHLVECEPTRQLSAPAPVQVQDDELEPEPTRPPEG